MPRTNPVKAGMNVNCWGNAFAAISMLGISRDQTDAAVITPAAKPIKARWSPSFMERDMKKTHAAPRVVPANGTSKPISVYID